MARAGRVAKPDGTIAPAPRVRKAVVDCFARRSIGSGTRAVTIAECTATRRETGIPTGEHAADAGTTGPRADRRGARRSRLDRPGPRRDEPRRGARDRGARVQDGARPRIRRLHAVRRWAGGRGARSETGRIYPVQRRVAGGQVCGRAAGRVASARRSAPVPVRQHRRRHAVHQRSRSRSEEPPHLAPPARSPAGDAGRLAHGRNARRLGEAPPSGSGRGLHGGAPDASLVAARPYPDVAGTGAGLPLSGTGGGGRERRMVTQARPPAFTGPDGDRLRQDDLRHHVDLPAHPLRRRAPGALPRRSEQPRRAGGEGVPGLPHAGRSPEVHRAVHCPAPDVEHHRRGQQGGRHHDPAPLLDAEGGAGLRGGG